MRKVLFILLSLAVVFGLSDGAFAKNGLSASLALGLNGNPGQLASVITSDGLEDSMMVDGTDATQAAIYSMIDLNISAGNITESQVGDYTKGDGYTTWFHRDKITLVEDEDGLIDDEEKNEIKDLETNGAMSALDIALHAKYTMMEYLWARLGFNYTFKLTGGETTWKANEYGITAKQSQEWDYKTWAIPLSVGLNLPLKDGKYDIYVGVGLTYVNGGWDLKVKRTYFESTTGVAGDVFTACLTDGFGTTFAGMDDFGHAKASETVEFRYSGIGFNYLIGVDAEVYENLKVFVEWETTLAGGYDTYKFDHPGLKALIGNYTKYCFVGGQVFRVGVNYWIMDPLGI